nr:transposase [Teredinibacter turnerae]
MERLLRIVFTSFVLLLGRICVPTLERGNEDGLPVVVVQPIHVRQFAKAQGILAKTDKLDARVIAEFGAIMKPPIRQIQTKKIQYFKDLLARRRQLMEARTQELNRLDKADKAIQ